MFSFAAFSAPVLYVFEILWKWVNSMNSVYACFDLDGSYTVAKSFAARVLVGAASWAGNTTLLQHRVVVRDSCDPVRVTCSVCKCSAEMGSRLLMGKFLLEHYPCLIVSFLRDEADYKQLSDLLLRVAEVDGVGIDWASVLLRTRPIMNSRLIQFTEFINAEVVVEQPKLESTSMMGAEESIEVENDFKNVLKELDRTVDQPIPESAAGFGLISEVKSWELVVGLVKVCAVGSSAATAQISVFKRLDDVWVSAETVTLANKLADLRKHVGEVEDVRSLMLVVGGYCSYLEMDPARVHSIFGTMFEAGKNFAPACEIKKSIDLLNTFLAKGRGGRPRRSLADIRKKLDLEDASDLEDDLEDANDAVATERKNATLKVAAQNNVRFDKKRKLLTALDGSVLEDQSENLMISEKKKRKLDK